MRVCDITTCLWIMSSHWYSCTTAVQRRNLDDYMWNGTIDGVNSRLLHNKALDVPWQFHVTNNVQDKIPFAVDQLWQRRLTFSGHCYRCEVAWSYGRETRKMLRGQGNRHTCQTAAAWFMLHDHWWTSTEKNGRTPTDCEVFANGWMGWASVTMNDLNTLG